MTKIKKDYSVKILVLLVAIVFFVNSTIYGISNKSCLRIPLLSNSQRIKEVLIPTLDREALLLKSLIADKLGEKYKGNIHHGLKHADDLIKKAHILIKRLGKEGQINWKILIASICLHDIGSKKKLHGEESARSARDFLSGFGVFFSEREIKSIEEAIILHEVRDEDGKARRKKAGIEAQVLYDIDQWDAFGVYGAYRYLAIYSERGDPYESILENVQSRYESFTFTEMRELAEEAYNVSIAFFERLNKEKHPDDYRGGATGVAYFIGKNPNEQPLVIAQEAIQELGRSSDEDSRFTVDYFEKLQSTYKEYGVAPVLLPYHPFPVDPTQLSKEKNVFIYEAGTFISVVPGLDTAASVFLTRDANTGEYLVIYKDEQVARFRSGDIITVGRSGDRTVVVDSQHKAVSRAHMEISAVRNTIIIKDTSSLGTHVQSFSGLKLNNLNQLAGLVLKEREERALRRVAQEVENMGGPEIFREKSLDEMFELLGAKEIVPTPEDGIYLVDSLTPYAIYITQQGYKDILDQRQSLDVKYTSPEEVGALWRLSPAIDGPGIYYCRAAINNAAKKGLYIDSVALYHELLEEAISEELAIDAFAQLPESHFNLRVVEETLAFAYENMDRESFENNLKNMRVGMQRMIKFAREQGYPDELIARCEENALQRYLESLKA